MAPATSSVAEESPSEPKRTCRKCGATIETGAADDGGKIGVTCQKCQQSRARRENRLVVPAFKDDHKDNDNESIAQQHPEGSEECLTCHSYALIPKNSHCDPCWDGATTTPAGIPTTGILQKCVGCNKKVDTAYFVRPHDSKKKSDAGEVKKSRTCALCRRNPPKKPEVVRSEATQVCPLCRKECSETDFVVIDHGREVVKDKCAQCRNDVKTVVRNYIKCVGPIPEDPVPDEASVRAAIDRLVADHYASLSKAAAVDEHDAATKFTNDCQKVADTKEALDTVSAAAVLLLSAKVRRLRESGLNKMKVADDHEQEGMLADLRMQTIAAARSSLG